MCEIPLIKQNSSFNELRGSMGLLPFWASFSLKMKELGKMYYDDLPNSIYNLKILFFVYQFLSCSKMFIYQFSSGQFSCSVMSDSLQLMACSTPGFQVHHQLPELSQTHVHWINDAIQLSHSLSSPSPPTFNLSQHRGLFQGLVISHQVAEIFVFQLQHQSFQWIFKTDFL